MKPSSIGLVLGVAVGLALSAPAMAWTTNDWQFLETIERANLRFFQQEKHGPYSLVNDTAYYDSTNNYPAYSSVAGVGFELTAICLGHYRGWISYSNAYEQVLHMTRAFAGELSGDPDVFKRDHGWTRHAYTIYGPDAGKPFDLGDGLSLLDHSLLVGGLVFVSEYFKGTEAGELAHRLYAETQWDWRANGDYDFGYSENLLAIVESAEAPAYKKGAQARAMWDSFIVPPWPRTLQLYFWQYPHAWIDFRYRWDAVPNNHADIARDSILYQRQRAIDLHAADPAIYDMIGSNVWGWTAAGSSEGYRQMAPWTLYLDATYETERASDSGSINPIGLPGCMVYAGTETMAALRHIYEQFYLNGWNPAAGQKPVWSDTYGFLNTLNTGQPWNASASNWYHTINAAIDYGPNVLLLENYKLGSTWRWFMQNPSISAGMTTLGFGPTQHVCTATFEGGTNEFGCSFGSWNNDATPVSIGYAPATLTNGAVADPVVRIVADHDNEGGWIDLCARDARAQALLTFWVRAHTGGEAIEVGLKDTLGTERKVALADVMGGALPTNWAEVKIPLERFCLTGDVAQDVWPGSLQLLSFAFVSPDGGGLDVDHVSFTRDTLPPARPPDGRFGLAMFGNRARARWDHAAAERDVVGYHLHRRYAVTDGFTRVTAPLVPAYRDGCEDTSTVATAGQSVRYAIQAWDNAEPAGGSAYAFEKVAVGGRFDLDWNDGHNPNTLGGGGDGHWGAPATQAFDFVRAATADGATNWVRHSLFQGTGGGHFMDLAGADLADHGALSFEIRGAAGGEPVLIGLRDTGAAETRIALASLLPGGIATNWARVAIPLAEFSGVDLAALETMSLSYDAPGEAWLANIAFLPPQRDVPGPAAATEAEDFADQVGSGGPDFKPAASAGAVLGNSWGGSTNSRADYEATLAAPLTGAWFHLWYALDLPTATVVDVWVDGAWRARLPCPSTGGWGERTSQFACAAAPLGALAAGPHAVRLASAAGVPLNLDCFRVGPLPPEARGPDADGDGVSDRAEAALQTGAADGDSDGDGLSDGDELAAARWGHVTDPARADTDGDGSRDRAEWIAATDPRDPASYFGVRGFDATRLVWPATTERLYRVLVADGAVSNDASFSEVADPGSIAIADGTGLYPHTLSAPLRTFSVDVRIP